MPFVPITNYKEIPFSKETPNDQYSFMTMSGMIDACFLLTVDIIKVRSIGVICSEYGRYHLKDLPQNSLEESRSICLSVKHIPSPPKSTIIPYAVQVFGDLHCRNKKPVLFVKIIQEIHPAVAYSLHNSIERLTRCHLSFPGTTLYDIDS